MNKLQPFKISISLGLTSALVNLGCFLVMLLLGKESLLKISNYLLHGINFSTIINTNISIGETIIGLIVSFLFFGGTGLLFTLIYNKIIR